MIYTTDTADKVARDASPEAAIWIRELAKQRDRLREALECLLNHSAPVDQGEFKMYGEAARKARAALEEMDNG